MILRPATQADAGGILAIIREAPGLPQWDRGALALPAQDGANRDAGPLRRLLAAVDGDEIAGFAQFSILLDEAELEGMAVAAAFRRQGIGRALLFSALSQAAEAGARIFRLEVRAGNAEALPLYLDAGWTVTGRRPAYYHNPVEDALLLERCLPHERKLGRESSGYHRT